MTELATSVAIYGPEHLVRVHPAVGLGVISSVTQEATDCSSPVFLSPYSTKAPFHNNFLKRPPPSCHPFYHIYPQVIAKPQFALEKSKTPPGGACVPR